MRQPGPASPRRITQMISWFKAASSFVSNLLLRLCFWLPCCFLLTQDYLMRRLFTGAMQT